MFKLAGKKVVEVPPEEEYLYSPRVKMVGNEVVNLTLEEAAERDAEEAAYQSQKQANKYKELRRNAYLPIEEQLDMLYWDLKTGTTTFVDHRSSVKAAYPKPV